MLSQHTSFIQPTIHSCIQHRPIDPTNVNYSIYIHTYIENTFILTHDSYQMNVHPHSVSHSLAHTCSRHTHTKREREREREGGRERYSFTPNINARTHPLTHSLTHTYSRHTHKNTHSHTLWTHSLTHSLTHFGGNGSVPGRWRSGRDRTSGSDDDSTQHKHIFSMHLTNIHISNSIQPTNILHPFQHPFINPTKIHPFNNPRLVHWYMQTIFIDSSIINTNSFNQHHCI